MLTKKKTARKSRSTQGVPQKALSKAYKTELSYETKIVITILLLLFVYPFGLIFMWAWMKNWPLWVKLLITLPFLLGILAFFGLSLLIGSLTMHANMTGGFQQYRQAVRQERTITPTTSTVTPIQNTYTY